MRTYSPELKAQVIAAVAMGEAKQAVAQRLGVPRSTVRVWTKNTQPVAMVTSEKQADIDALYTDFVSESLLALRTIARRSQDKNWLSSLKPSDAYLWYGTVADKVLAALQAYEAAGERRAGRVAGVAPGSGEDR